MHLLGAKLAHKSFSASRIEGLGACGGGLEVVGRVGDEEHARLFFVFFHKTTPLF